MSQSALTALRDFFPEACVDYIVNRTAYPLIEGNPEASRVLPFFSKGPFPSYGDLSELRDMIQRGRYDLVINFCPYLNGKDIGLNKGRMLDFLTYAPTIVRNEKRPSQINHFAYQTYRFTRQLLSPVAEPHRPEHYRGLRVMIGSRAVEEAKRIAAGAGLTSGMPAILFNPDAASPFTRMPFEKQARLLARIARLNTAVLVAAGHTERGLGKRLISSLAHSFRSQVMIVPASLSLEAFTALIDICDVFVTGDTGPLHLAAARKFSRSGRHKFRNRTAILSIFGATPARMSGYDSFQPGYLPANQDAPSWSYTARNPCRNITCLNKTFKTCRTLRCFDEVDEEGMAGLLSIFLKALSYRQSSQMEPGR
jgi:ADP-heptose:LPS heptosyltransferase